MIPDYCSVITHFLWFLHARRLNFCYMSILASLHKSTTKRSPSYHLSKVSPLSTLRIRIPLSST